MPAKKQLVLEHLERVSGEIMEKHPKVLQGQIRGRWGVYALYKKDRLYYVGLANNLSARLKQHTRDRLKGRWDRFSVYLTVRDDHMKELESLILRIAKPQGNRTGGRFAKSKDLGRTLNRLMGEEDANQRARLMGGNLAKQRERRRTRKEGIGALKGLLEKRRDLRGFRQGNEYRATLRRDGTIKYNGEVFASPTGATRAAIGLARNGWNFWRYRDNSGQWVQLRTLRQ
jgi:hypothetical protein